MCAIGIRSPDIAPSAWEMSIPGIDCARSAGAETARSAERATNICALIEFASSEGHSIDARTRPDVKRWPSGDDYRIASRPRDQLPCGRDADSIGESLPFKTRNATATQVTQKSSSIT